MHPWNPPAALLREARAVPLPAADRRTDPRPAAHPDVVTRILRGAWGDRETYDRAAEPIYAEPYKTTAGAASQYYRQFLTREPCAGRAGG